MPCLCTPCAALHASTNQHCIPAQPASNPLAPKPNPHPTHRPTYHTRTQIHAHKQTETVLNQYLISTKSVPPMSSAGSPGLAQVCGAARPVADAAGQQGQRARRRTCRSRCCSEASVSSGKRMPRSPAMPQQGISLGTTSSAHREASCTQRGRAAQGGAVRAGRGGAGRGGAGRGGAGRLEGTCGALHPGSCFYTRGPPKLVGKQAPTPPAAPTNSGSSPRWEMPRCKPVPATKASAAHVCEATHKSFWYEGSVSFS